MLTLLPLVLSAFAQDPAPKLVPDPDPAPALTPVPGSLPAPTAAEGATPEPGGTPSPVAGSPTEAPVGTPAPHSGGGGIVVRFDGGATPLSAPVVVTLMPPFGNTPELTLEDSGKGADVTAGDNVWSAAGQAEGDTYKVTVRAGEQTWDAGEVSWPADAKQRDVSITMVDGKPKAEGATSGVATRFAGQEPTGSPAQVAAPAAAAGGSDPTVWIAVGAGGLLLAAFAWLWLNSGGKALPKHLARQPEAPAFGGPTPAWSGPSQWVVRPEDRAELVPVLLATLARGRRVLVVAPAGVDVPAVAGGPVWRAGKAGPKDLLDGLEGLGDGGSAVALLDLRGDASFVALLRKVEPGTGIVAVVDAPVDNGTPVVTATRVPGGWTIAVGGATVDLRVVEGALTPIRRP